MSDDSSKSEAEKIPKADIAHSKKSEESKNSVAPNKILPKHEKRSQPLGFMAETSEVTKSEGVEEPGVEKLNEVA